MAITQVSDIIIPELFEPYIVERTAELSKLITSGIIERSPQMDAKAGGGGKTVDMPFWEDLTGDDEVITSGGSLTTKKITTDKDVAIINNRGSAWSTEDLAKYLAGADPFAAIGNLVADFWVRKRQASVISMLTGIFAAASMSGNLHAIHKTSGGAGTASDAQKLNGTTFIDAKQLLGDSSGKLTAIIMHSAVEASLRKLNLIDSIPDSDGVGLISVFQTLRVIVDDTMPTSTVDGDTVYTSYLFGQGAIAEGNASLSTPVEGGHGTEAVEFGRTVLAGVNQLVNRQRFILHCRGVKWLGASLADESPTNAELATGTNWERVYENKNVRVVKVTHNI